MKSSQQIVECLEFREHPNWQQKHPIGPVTWDAWCSKCGFQLEDKPWADGLVIEGEGRRLEYFTRVLVVNGETFRSEKRRIICSNCITTYYENLETNTKET